MAFNTQVFKTRTLTAIIFALETTGQVNALLPLLASCTIAYFISLYLMEHTIMTEKIARRGIKTPETYRPDILEQYTVKQVLDEAGLVISEENTIADVREWLKGQTGFISNYFVIVTEGGGFSGIISSSNLFSEQHDPAKSISSLIKRKPAWIKPGDTLKTAVELMVNENTDLLPVLDENQVVTGVLTHKNILNAYKISMTKHVKARPGISLRRQTMKLLLKGQRLMSADKKKV